MTVDHFCNYLCWQFANREMNFILRTWTEAPVQTITAAVSLRKIHREAQWFSWNWWGFFLLCEGPCSLKHIVKTGINSVYFNKLSLCWSWMTQCYLLSSLPMTTHWNPSQYETLNDSGLQVQGSGFTILAQWDEQEFNFLLGCFERK